MKLDKNTKISPFVIARYEHGYETASSLYKEIHLDKGTYSLWENGNTSHISEGKTFAAFQKMCEIFGWTLEGGRNSLSNMYKWKHDDEIKIIKPTYDEWKSMRGHTEMTTLDTSKTDISKEEAMLNNPLKVWRGKNNLTRSEAAKLCHVDVNVYSDCEDGIKKPNGFDLTKILKGADLHFLDIQKIFRDDTVKTVIENALEASKNQDPVTLENDVISVKICDEIDHNKVIEEVFEASKKANDDEVLDALEKTSKPGSKINEKLKKQTVSYRKEESDIDDFYRPANNSKNIAISKQTARYILRTLYGVLEYNEYYKILSEFTKGGLNL